MTEQQILHGNRHLLIARISGVNQEIKNMNTDAMFLMAGGWDGKCRIRDLRDLKVRADSAKKGLESLLKGIDDIERELEQADKED